MVAYKERAPGVYRAKFVKLDTEYPITDKASGDEVIRWLWTFQEVADPTTMGQMDALTSPGFKSRSNGLKFFSGMLGRAPTPADDTDAQVGQVFDVVYGPNQNGRHTVTAVMLPTGAAPSGGEADAPGTVPVPSPAPSPDNPDDLPF